MRPLILASTSPYRRRLLERLGLPFEVARPEVDEAPREGETPAERAQRLALAKAHAVAMRHRDAVVIGSDQVAAVGNTVLDKPGDAATCVAQLERLSGNTAVFYTACAVVTASEARQHLDETQVVFRLLSSAEIGRYVERERPFDCAGGFKAEALGVALFEHVESRDPTGLIGLPLIWVAAALRAEGYRAP